MIEVADIFRQYGPAYRVNYRVNYPGSGAKGEIWNSASPFTPSIEMGLTIHASL